MPSLIYMPDYEFADKSAPAAAMEPAAEMDFLRTEPLAAPAQQVPTPPTPPVAASPSVAPVISAPAQPPGDASGNAIPREQVSAGKSAAWALEGLRCLNIDLTPAKFGETVTFASLGIDPSLHITVVNERRWNWLGAAFGLVIFIVGLTRIHSGVASRLKYAVAMVIGCMLIALASVGQSR